MEITKFYPDEERYKYKLETRRRTLTVKELSFKQNQVQTLLADELLVVLRDFLTELQLGGSSTWLMNELAGNRQRPCV